MREERIVVAGRELVIVRPDDLEALIDDHRFDDDEFLPYWAELWPSGIALAEHLAGLDLRGWTVLELGCGLAVPALAAAAAGATVLATDWAPEAIDLVAANAAVNGLEVTAAVLDWRSGCVPSGHRFDLVVAADVLYEERNARPLLGLLEAAVALGGEVLIADPGRRHAALFFEVAQEVGWLARQVATGRLPGGGITNLRRSA